MTEEGSLQRRIIEDLGISGWVVNKVMKSNQAGWPDVEAYKEKEVVFIETKSRGKAAKPLQKYQHRRLQDQGFHVFVIDTWEQYLQIKYLHLK